MNRSLLVGQARTSERCPPRKRHWARLREDRVDIRSSSQECFRLDYASTCPTLSKFLAAVVNPIGPVSSTKRGSKAYRVLPKESFSRDDFKINTLMNPLSTSHLMTQLEHIDKQILGTLGGDCRTPYREIAKSLGMSATAIKSRADDLVASGVIIDYLVEFSPAMIGSEVMMVWLKTDGTENR